MDGKLPSFLYSCGGGLAKEQYIIYLHNGFVALLFMGQVELRFDNYVGGKFSRLFSFLIKQIKN